MLPGPGVWPGPLGSPWSWKYSKTTACTGVTATDRVRSASSTSMVTRPRVCFQLRVRMAWGGLGSAQATQRAGQPNVAPLPGMRCGQSPLTCSPGAAVGGQQQGEDRGLRFPPMATTTGQCGPDSEEKMSTSSAPEPPSVT